MKKSQAQIEWELEQARADRRKWLTPLKKNPKDGVSKQSEILCVQCGYIWIKADDDMSSCPKCRR